MTDTDLDAKKTYFEEQRLLDISDDEADCDGDVYNILESAMAETDRPKPPKLARHTSSFLGPTPKEVKADFEAHTNRRRAVVRGKIKTLLRSSTAPEVDSWQSFPVVKPRARELSAGSNANGKMKRVTSLPNMTGFDQVPFYHQMGVVPRELRNGKNVKLADNIKLLPEPQQLLRGKIVYFFPNDDVSMVRRTRIHKLIQLGAAWVKKWRDDVTHVLVDDPSHTYSQLLRYLNMAGFPKNVVVAKFEPYIVQCIQFGTLMDPSAARFSIKGAPRRAAPSRTPDTTAVSECSGESQTSLKIKPTRKQRDAVPSQKTDSIPTEGSPSQMAEKLPESPLDRVEDSFVMPSSDAVEESPKTTVPDTLFGEEFLQAIRETKAIAHLPIDDDEDEGSPTPSVIGAEEVHSDTDEEPLEMSGKPRKKPVANGRSTSARTTRKGFDQSGFQCMDPSTGGYSSQNPNARTIEILEEMGRYYDQMQDTWRTLAYRRGVTTLKKQTTTITTAKQAAALPFIGTKLAEKIEEIVLTDRLRKLDNTKDNPLDQVLRLFLGVYGCGLVQANKWIQVGHRTLDDLLTKAHLTTSQKVGIAHYSDFNSRIPRTEVAAHGALVSKALHAIDPSFTATTMGSYRRGAQDSGDIDILITHPAASPSHLHTLVFKTLIPCLFASSYLQASLTSPKDTASSSKWHGASRLPGSTVWRRIDFLLVPGEELGAALLYFTGNDLFNRSMRLLARKKGMRLNQRGLFEGVRRGARGERVNDGVRVEGRCERGIFRRLGVPWREPVERIC